MTAFFIYFYKNTSENITHYWTLFCQEIENIRSFSNNNLVRCDNPEKKRSSISCKLITEFAIEIVKLKYMVEFLWYVIPCISSRNSTFGNIGWMQIKCATCYATYITGNKYNQQ